MSQHRHHNKSVMLMLVLTASLLLAASGSYPRIIFAQDKQPAVKITAPTNSRYDGQAKDTVLGELHTYPITSTIYLNVSWPELIPAGKVPSVDIKLYNVRLQYLEYSWNEHTGWYVPEKDQTFTAAVDSFAKEHPASLEQRIARLQEQISTEAGSKQAPDQATISRLSLLDSLSQQQQFAKENGLVLAGFSMYGDLTGIEKFLKESSIENAKYKISLSNSKGLPPENLAPTGGVPYPNEPWKFSPTNGNFYYDAGSKRIGSNFYWKDTSGFNSVHRAYEHDITIFAAKDQYVRPGTGTYYSNLPAAYIDTTFSDNNASFTIGSNWSPGIATYTWYYTELPLFVINPAMGATTGVIQPQLGSWAGQYDDGDSPGETTEYAFCIANGGSSPAWCVFADQTHTVPWYYTPTSNYVNFPFDHRRSSAYQWDRNFDPNSLSCPVGQFRGRYYRDRFAPRHIFSQCDTYPLSKYWGAGGPGYGVPNDNFKVIWDGAFYLAPGTYRFAARADDGVSVAVGGSQIINGWRDQPETLYTSDRVAGGGYYSIRMDYFENGGGATAALRWDMISTPNLLLNKPASATSIESSYVPASKGNDGNITTRWSSMNSPTTGSQLWQADMGSVKNFNKVFVRWEAAYAKTHFIGWSNDGYNYTGYWYTIGGAGTYRYDIGTRSGRYIGVFMTERAPNMGNYSFWEVEAYQSSTLASTPDQLVVDHPEQEIIASPLGKPVTLVINGTKDGTANNQEVTITPTK